MIEQSLLYFKVNSLKAKTNSKKSISLLLCFFLNVKVRITQQGPVTKYF